VIDLLRKIRGASDHMKKRKRAPGGGRKPGEFGRLNAVMGLRLPEELRDRLRLEAKRNGRTLSGELIFRVKESFDPERSIRDLSFTMRDLSKKLARLKRDLASKQKEEG
jgi:predicted DNA-binding protein